MQRTHAFAGLACAILLNGSGCGDAREYDAESVVSAIGNFPADIRGYTRQGNVHSLVLRTNLGQIAELHSFSSVATNNTAGGSPWPYKRADNVNAILYIDNNQHVHEVTVVQNPNYFDTDLSAAPINAPLAAAAPLGAPMPDVIGYVRSDHVNAIVYRSANDHIIELTSNFQNSPPQAPWLANDLTGLTSAPSVGKGSAFPFVRTDNVNSIVYVGTDNHIHEIASNFPNQPSWSDSDLFTASGETTTPSTDPWAYKRSDGKNAVVFIGVDNKLHELSLNPTSGCSPGLPWCAGVITAATSPTGGLFHRPSGYVRTDSKNAVVFVANNSTQVHEVTLATGGQWVQGSLPLNGFTPTGQVFGHVAPNNGVLQSGAGGGMANFVYLEGFKSGTGHLGLEIALPAGVSTWNLISFTCPGINC